MKITFTAAHKELAQTAFAELTKRYGQNDIANADIIVALGGDGHVLHTLHNYMDYGKPIFAMRRTTSVGFLCNDFNIDRLPERLAAAQKVVIHPLHVIAKNIDGKTTEARSINEVAIFREHTQAANLNVKVDGTLRLEKFVGDGIMVASPTGSTAYNYSCGGPILPLDSNSIVLTAISPYRPRRWSHAILSQNAKVEIDVLDASKRPVRIESGQTTMHRAAQASITLDLKKNLYLMFDPGQHLGERIVREQFTA